MRSFLRYVDGFEMSLFFWCWVEDTDLEMGPYCRWSKWPPLAVCHAGSHALGKVCHRLVDVFLWWAAFPRRSTKRLSTHQSSWVSAGVYGTFPTWRPRCDSPVGSYLENFGITVWWTQDSWHAASPAWCAPCELRRHPGRWSLDWSLQSSAVRVYFQVCIFIAATWNRLISEPPTFRRKRSKILKTSN